MQHGTLLNVWLILLVHYGQTDDICGAGKIRRGDKCCLSEICENTGFAACIVNNTKDTCTPCSEGFYLIGKYETSYFTDPDVCALKKKCFPEEVKNVNGECVCDVSRGYYGTGGGICDLELISCTPAGRQLNQNGQCDPCPVGYFKPVSGKQRCRKKSNITCSSTEIILEGNTTTDRKCVKNDLIVSTSTYSPPLSTSINITNDVIDRNGNDALLKWVIIAVVVFVIALSFVVGVILLVRHRRLRRRQQSQDLENHEHDEHVPLQPVNGELPIVDDDNFENEADLNQFPQDNIPNDDDNCENEGDLNQDNNQRGCMAVPYGSPEDNIPNDDDNFENEADINQFPQDNIPNDVDTVDIGTDHYPSPQDNIPNVTDRPQAIDDGSHSCGEEVITSVNSQTYVKQLYTPHDSSIDNAVRGDMPIDEYNSNQEDEPINPLPGDDTLCQGAVGGDIDDNDTTSSINNENHVNLLNDQPEHNSLPGRMVVGPQSFDFPVQNPDPNLPHLLPHYHDGSSDEGDSGFQA